jgi:pimeloyl-ACP methyl ester carboxylesterase
MNLVVNGIMLQYSELGNADAPVILMLHGWGVSSQSFDSMAKPLSARYRVILLDLPGFGGSEMPPTDWHIHDYAELVQSFVSKAQFGRLNCIVGHSFGGRVAIKAVGKSLLKPRKLILMGSAGVRHSDTFRNQSFKTVAKVGKLVTALPGLSLVRDKLRLQLYRTAGSTDYLTAGPLQQVFLNTINEDLQSDAAAISIPTLLIWGDLDTETPVADGQLLANKIQGSNIRIVEHAGHFVYLDALERVTGYVEEFLA